MFTSDVNKPKMVPSSVFPNKAIHHVGPFRLILDKIIAILELSDFPFKTTFSRFTKLTKYRVGQWRIQDFPEKGAPTLKRGGGLQPTICLIFPENSMKMKKFGRGGARIPGTPLRSATVGILLQGIVDLPPWLLTAIQWPPCDPKHFQFHVLLFVCRVHTCTGKPGKLREVFSVREKSLNFKILPESQGILVQSGKIRSEYI